MLISVFTVLFTVCVERCLSCGFYLKTINTRVRMYSDEDGGGGGQTETNENGNKATSSIAV